MYWGRPVKIDTALYPIFTQRNLAVAPDDISMPLNPDLYGVVKPGGTVGYPAHPRLIRPSVRTSVISLLSFLRKIAQAQQIW